MYLKFTLLFTFAIYLSACGVQSIPKAKNSTEAALAEITNQYKRRTDLVPNLVKVVQGFAKQEKEVLVGVTEARANATKISIDPSKATPAQLAQYQQAQGQLSQALGRLLAVSENYPNLKSNENFRDLQAQLEGTENRITVARQRYIESILAFNNLVTVFPTSLTNSWFFNYEKMPQWDVDAAEKESVQQVPQVNF